MKPRVLFLFSLFAVSSSARAQEAESAIASAREASRVLGEQVACLTHKRQEIDRQVALMEQARTQLRSSSGTDAMRADAQTTIQTIGARVATLLRESQACGGVTNGQTANPRREVVYVAPPPDPAADSVARPPSGPPVVEENATIDNNVRVVVAHRVDGEGELEGDVARRAIRTAMPAISACYEQMVDRGALVNGQLILVFTIGAGGRVSRVAVEGDTIHNSRFSQCVRTAGARIHASSAPQGGNVRYAYTLAFPAE